MSDFRSLTFYLLRHGECQHNLEGRVAGRNDTPLTPKGREQARAAGKLLREIEDELDEFQFLASPLRRASATMEIVREAADLLSPTYSSDLRLAELDCGANTLREWREIEAEFDACQTAEDRWTLRHPGGESVAELYARAGEFLASLQKDAVIVSHAGPVRMIRAHYLRLPQREILEFKPLHAAIIRLSTDNETHWNV